MVRIQKRYSFLKIFFNPLFFVLLFSLISLWDLPASASRVKKPINKQRLIPANFLEWGKDETNYAVLVDKSLQKVMIYRGDNLFAPEKVYYSSTGENDGAKDEVNDRKTPEGIYFFINNFEKKYLSPIYGSRALPIDYPNIVDKKNGKKGYGIWFHGTNKPLKPKDTNGCIALENNDIEEIASLVTLFKTPVIISSQIKMAPPDVLKEKAEKIKKIIESWRRAWEGKDIESYMSFYNRRFTSGSKNLKMWERYKTRLAKKYKYIHVDIEDLTILENDGIILAIFKQTYRTPSFQSRGIKRLYFTKNSKQWKIIGEEFKGAEKQRIPAEKPVIFTRREVEDFIYAWKHSWETKDLAEYISCYAPDFTSRGMNLNSWKRHRDRLNKKYKSVHVTISDLRINRVSDRNARVRFTQSYKADSYKDLGIKKIVLVRKGGDWKIKEEEWTPIRKRSLQ